jgi:hypothetical protein
MSRIKFECVHADTCLPDYWSGHHLPHVSIPVWHGMSLKDIKQSIKNEIKHGAIAGNDNDTMLLSYSFIPPESEALADKLTKAAYAAVNRITPKKKGQRRFFTDLEKETEDNDYSVYAYFVFVREN